MHVLEASFIKEESLIWIVDSGVTNHVYSSLQILSNYRKLEDGEFTLTVGNGKSFFAKAVGQTRLILGKNYLLLDNVYSIPAITRNLISISELCRKVFLISFNNNEIIISRNSFEIYHTCLDNGLYILRPYKSFTFNTEIFKIAKLQSNKCQKVSHDNETDRKSTRLNSSHSGESRMPSSA